MWDAAKGFCVRAAISPLFASPLAEDVVPDLSDVAKLAAGSREQGMEEEVKKDGVDGCQNCGKEAAKEGGALKACAKCQKVKYCGRDCQRADWKRHKGECVAKK
jgi:hypothetical protein